MVSEDDIVKFALALDDVTVKEVAPDEKRRIFCRGERIFCVISRGYQPVRLDLRCDSKLAKTLQERYESVMESRALGRNGIEIVCSGQLSDDEVYDLIRHAYEVSAPEARE
jgi:predicted DNA-binding protein (MmcQ/YjbR family)